SVVTSQARGDAYIYCGVRRLRAIYYFATAQLPISCASYRLTGGTLVACPRNYEPVCGTNEVTYPNECNLCAEILRNRAIKKKHDGRCVHQVDCTGHTRSTLGVAVPCTMEYTPICGTNGVTYSNKCRFCNAVANGLNLDVRHQGTCSEASNNPGIDCSEFQISNLVCPTSYDPLCASDGKTYGNKCQFCSALAKSRGALALKHHGQC
ncbi:double-headed protease inhibitor, submandibular gland-like, partial [Indicator indicator]|uniref:double-headed protease inhibitor, submandibular gland-like n=1 Tax=Indicator indicator TaxID=1002788 RepID=UPI0023DF2B82